MTGPLIQQFEADIAKCQEEMRGASPERQKQLQEQIDNDQAEIRGLAHSPQQPEESE
jgi:hypothetical protein